MTMMKRAALALATILPTALMAQDSLDDNADGMISFDEIQAVFPEIDSDTFMSADTDGDALLSADELAAAQEAGLIPMQES